MKEKKKPQGITLEGDIHSEGLKMIRTYFGAGEQPPLREFIGTAMNVALRHLDCPLEVKEAAKPLLNARACAFSTERMVQVQGPLDADVSELEDARDCMMAAVTFDPARVNKPDGGMLVLLPDDLRDLHDKIGEWNFQAEDAIQPGICGINRFVHKALVAHLGEELYDDLEVQVDLVSNRFGKMFGKAQEYLDKGEGN